MTKYPKSPLWFVLQGLIPYSRANIALSFKPAAFFNELDRLEKVPSAAARSAYYRAVRRGLIEFDEQGAPYLTPKGRLSLQKFEPQLLKNSQLMVIFDIPEADRWKRRQLRSTLKEFSFKKVQQSVWVTNLDCKDYLKEEISRLDLSDSVKIYESREVI